MSDLDVIRPPGVNVTFGGQVREITPLKIGQLPAFARVVKPLASAINTMLAGAVKLDSDFVLELIADHGDEVVDAMSIATGIPADEIRQADAAELLSLVPPVLKSNRDFLIGRLSPEIRAAVSMVFPGKAGAGPTP